MRTTELTVRNPSGIHARPAALFVRTVAKFRAKVTLQNVTGGGEPVDAKSMIALMKAAPKQGQVIRLVAEGEDEDAAIAALEEAVTSGLGEAV